MLRLAGRAYLAVGGLLLAVVVVAHASMAIEQRRNP